MHNQGCERIVLPLDLTKETRDKVDQAIMFAKLFKAEIYIISILLTGKEDVVNKLKDQLVIVRQHIERENVQCTAEIIKILKSEESLSNAVIKYAEKINADLIMIMTQQENEIKQLFIGSKAKEIIKNSEIPVLSIKPLSLNRIEIS
jgi:nucleotide-binding universal stress UspA family protein